MAGDGEAATWWQKYGKTALLLLVFFATALFIRSYFNFDASYNEGDFRWSGTDGYYHMRVIDHIRETGDFLLRDPLLNYPVGATNPRPPIFDWTIAAAGGLLAPFFGGDAAKATDYAAAFSPAVWAALTVFPIYFLGKEAFNRKAGLWAAFFVAVMASHITRSNLGALDHDATILFFFVLGAFFFTRALKRMSRDVYVEDYRRAGTILPGMARFIRENQVSVLHSVLTGTAFAAIALTWQGYPYVWAVFAVWFGFQLLANHLRNQDSTGHFILMLVSVLTTLVLITPYYNSVGRVDTYVMPTVYILVGMLAASLIFVPTRHLPPVLVLPVTFGAALAGILLLLFVFQDIGELFFSGLGYFVQSKLYSTIAEAQRTPLGYLVFATGVIPFFFALAGIGFALVSFIKKRRDDHLFVLVWAAVGLLMAFTATRFVFNASVGFAVLAGWVTQRFVHWVRFGEVSKSWRGVRGAGYNLFKSFRSSVKTRHVLASLFLVFILLMPSIWAGVDAGVPGEYRQKKVTETDGFVQEFWGKYTGAFGQDFLSSHWIDALGYLSEQDTDLPIEERPAFIAWWDYGFYAVQRGDHPTVADPFQFGFQIAGNFLASQSEEEGIVLMAVRLLEGDAYHSGIPGSFSPDVEAVLESYEPGLADALHPLARGQQYRQAFDRIVEAVGDGGNLDHADAAAFYADVRGATGTSISYFTLDGRMFPCDDPRSQGIDSGSIFYAPVFLADKNPEDFVKTRYLDGSGNVYHQKIYDTDESGVSFQVDQPHVVDRQGNRYLLSGGSLLPMAENGYIDYNHPLATTGLGLSSEELEYTPQFYNTLLYRAWIGPQPANTQEKVPLPDQWAPGYGLKHFRLVYTTARVAADDSIANRCAAFIEGQGTTGYTHGVTILKYYDGAPVSGVVRDDDGSPMAGVTVRVVDNFGIMHDEMTTDANGTFELVAPFSTEDDPSERASRNRPQGLRGVGPNAIEVVVNGVAVTSQNFSVTEEQANGGGPAIAPFDLTVALGSVSGLVYDDVDDDGVFDAANDTVLSGATVRLGSTNTTTGDDGRYTLQGVVPGSRSLQISAAGYENATRQVTVPSGGAATADIGMTASPIEVFGVVAQADATPLEGATVRFEKPVLLGGDPDEYSAQPTDENGNYTVDVPRGTWEASVDYQTIEDNQTVRYYTEQAVTVELSTGDPPRRLDITVRREVVS